MKKGGIFITLEGTDGVGKTTQGHLLADWLRKDGRDVVETREPGGGAAARVGEQIRAILLDPLGQMAPLTELMLYEAARAEHVEKVIRPALAAGKVVICDRYTDSTLAYQGAARGLPHTIINQLNRIATGGLRPALTLLLDLAPKHALKKAVARTGAGDRMENEGEEFQRRVRAGFLAAAKREPRRVKVIKVKPTIEATRAEIQKAVAKALA
jgi:dTMP kinase